MVVVVDSPVDSPVVLLLWWWWLWLLSSHPGPVSVQHLLLSQHICNGGVQAASSIAMWAFCSSPVYLVHFSALFQPAAAAAAAAASAIAAPSSVSSSAASLLLLLRLRLLLLSGGPPCLRLKKMYFMVSAGGRAGYCC